MKDLIQKTPCAISQEMVELVIHLYPDDFKKFDGGVDIEKILYSLGFDLDKSLNSKGYYRVENVLVRDNANPSRVYRTKCVYNGQVRTDARSVNPYGVEEYNDNRHAFVRLYERYEVVQPRDLEQFIGLEDFSNILDVGCKDYYDKGFLAMSKPPSLSSRNIVRKQV